MSDSSPTDGPTRVVIATDGSAASLAAADQVTPLLPAGAEVHLVTVVPHIDDPEEMAGGIEGPLGTPEQVAQDRARQEVEATGALAATARAFGAIPVIETVIEGGDPGDALCRHAEEIGAAMLVVGSHGRGWMKRLLLGSVSTHVIHHATVPVLVMPRPDDDELARLEQLEA